MGCGRLGQQAGEIAGPAGRHGAARHRHHRRQFGIAKRRHPTHQRGKDKGQHHTGPGELRGLSGEDASVALRHRRSQRRMPPNETILIRR
jgi:hypothetical protein